MTKEVIVDDDALGELERGVQWYDGKRLGLGDELLEEVVAVLNALPTDTSRGEGANVVGTFSVRGDKATAVVNYLGRGSEGGSEWALPEHEEV